MKTQRLILFVFLLLSACTSRVPYYRYEFDEDALASSSIKTVIIQPLFVPDVPALANARRLEPMLRSYLEDHGFAVVPFEKAAKLWEASLAVHRPLYDPKTGEPDLEVMREVYLDYLNGLRDQGICDAVVDAAVVGRRAKLAGRVALWDGVERRIPMKTAGQGLNWSGHGDVLSLRITVFSTAGTMILRNYGGLEYPHEHFLEAGKLDSKLRPDMFLNDELLQHAIATAVHPFIQADDYPASPRFYVTVPD